MKAIDHHNHLCRLLFEYHGNYQTLVESGMNIQSMFGGNCYSATVSYRKLKKLEKSISTLRIISYQRIPA